MDCKFSYKDSCTKSKRVSLPPTMILEKSQHYIIIITFDWSLILHPCFSLVNNWHAFWFTHFHYNTEKYRNGSMFWFTWYHILSWLFSVNATDLIFGWWNELISDIHNDCLIQLLGQLRPLMCKLRDLRYVATVWLSYGWDQNIKDMPTSSYQQSWYIHGENENLRL